MRQGILGVFRVKRGLIDGFRRKSHQELSGQRCVRKAIMKRDHAENLLRYLALPALWPNTRTSNWGEGVGHYRGQKTDLYGLSQNDHRMKYDQGKNNNEDKKKHHYGFTRRLYKVLRQSFFVTKNKLYFTKSIKKKIHFFLFSSIR